MTLTQATLDLFNEPQTVSNESQPLRPGEVRTIGNWQVRNYKGFYQSREGGVGDWQFHISSFDSSMTGSAGKCSLILAGGGTEDVPIDAQDRITVDGIKYGRKHWKH